MAKYTQIDDAVKLMLAHDRLRGLESDHFRISLGTSEAESGRLEALEREIEHVRAYIDEAQEERRQGRPVPDPTSPGQPPGQEDEGANES